MQSPWLLSGIMLQLLYAEMLNQNWVTILFSYRLKNDGSSEQQWLEFQSIILDKKEQHRIREYKSLWGFKTWALAKGWTACAQNKSLQSPEITIWCQADCWMVTPNIISNLRELTELFHYSVEVWKVHTLGARKTPGTKFKTDAEPLK